MVGLSGIRTVDIGRRAASTAGDLNHGATEALVPALNPLFLSLNTEAFVKCSEEGSRGNNVTEIKMLKETARRVLLN